VCARVRTAQGRGQSLRAAPPKRTHPR